MVVISLSRSNAASSRGQRAELDEATIQLFDRPPTQNIRDSFEKILGTTGQIPEAVPLIESDHTAIRAVAANPSTVTFLSLRPALDAMKEGGAIRVLIIDEVEATEQAVEEGRYRLRRPVLLLSSQQPHPLVEAFTAFALSTEGQKIVKELFIPYCPPLHSFANHDG